MYSIIHWAVRLQFVYFSVYTYIYHFIGLPKIKSGPRTEQKGHKDCWCENASLRRDKAQCWLRLQPQKLTQPPSNPGSQAETWATRLTKGNWWHGEEEEADFGNCCNQTGVHTQTSRCGDSCYLRQRKCWARVCRYFFVTWHSARIWPPWVFVS